MLTAVAAAIGAGLGAGVDDRDLPVDFSVGLASCPSDADSVEALAALADTRLYADKAKRRSERTERGPRGEQPSPAGE